MALSDDIEMAYPETYERPQPVGHESEEWPLGVLPIMEEEQESPDEPSHPHSEGGIQLAAPHAKRATLTHSGKQVDNFVIEYGGGEIWEKTERLPEDEIVITFKRPAMGARWRTMQQCTEGRFGAKIKMCAGHTDGIVASFYTSSHEGSKDMDEVDFEFLGKDKTHVQTNFFVNGKGGHEKWQALGFDASKDFHYYEIDIRADRITWFVDGEKIRVEDRTTNPKLPSKPFYLYAGVWDASRNGLWAVRKGETATFKDEPYYMHYKQVSVPAKAVARQ